MRMNNCIVWVLMLLFVGLVSCKKDPEIPIGTAFNSIVVVEGNSPTIYVLDKEGYVKNGDVVDVNIEFNFGFVMASSIETGKELSSLVLKIDDNAPDTIALTGKDYTYKGALIYELTRDKIIGTSTIEAIVIDAAGKTASASIKLSINKPEDPVQILEPNDFTWFRHGSNPGEGLAEYGLEWTNNVKEVFAVIKPVNGATLHGFSPDIWNEVTTEAEKVAAFENSGLAMTDFRGVSAWSSKDYDFVIGTIYNGEYHLIHITHGTVVGSGATDITITGQAK